jgi:hypothetical protein
MFDGNGSKRFRMKRLLLTAVSLFLFSGLYSQGTDWSTPFERSGGLETPRYRETVDYLKRLAEASPMITLTSIGKSARGADIPLLIVDREGLSEPFAIHAAGRSVLLVQACIHPGESEGKDAGMMFIRDLTVTSAIPRTLLNNVSILFIPILNVDGHERFGPYNRINQNGPREMGWRVTANNLNLNRDFLKADAPEMAAWLRFFNEWMPDFFVDCHTTDGADYQYVVTYLMEIYGDMDPRLTTWSRDTFIRQFRQSMENAGYPVFPYVDFRRWHDPRSGLITEVAPPMLSQGYTALRNRPGLLIETHMLKPYDIRVKATYESLKISLGILDRENTRLRGLISQADQFCTSPEFLKLPFPLQFETNETDSTMVDFRGFDYTVEKSPLSGGDWFRYSHNPVTFRLPYFFKTRPVVTAKLPAAYIIPAEWKSVIDRLQLHGIQVRFLQKGTAIRVTSCRLRSPKWQQNPYEGRHPMTSIEYDEFPETRWFPPGSAVVEVPQQAARIIPHILEPKGNGSYLYWGFFDAVFEQKEYAESYVLESLAEKMCRGNPSLLEELNRKKASDTTFAKNPLLILNWFYNQSPWADPRKNVYPVGKIVDRSIVDGLFKD